MSESDTQKRGAPDLRAAALKYDADRDRAPQVVAAGSGYVAQKILQVAIENGVSIYHDDSAATMLAKLDVGKEIPQELYRIVVNIYISLLDAADKRHNPRKYQDEEQSEEAAAQETEGPAPEDGTRQIPARREKGNKLLDKT
jgi:flagellar biosynthesis protein